jgi:hypothetical protein
VEESRTIFAREVVNGDMPEGKYMIIHRRARVSEDERDAICQWVERVRGSVASPTAVSERLAADILRRQPPVRLCGDTISVEE